MDVLGERRRRLVYEKGSPPKLQLRAIRRQFGSQSSALPCTKARLTIQMPACAIGAVPVLLLANARPMQLSIQVLSVRVHTNPQIVMKRLSLSLTSIASPP